MAGSWVWFRNDFRREDTAERITLRFMALFVVSLEVVSMQLLVVYVKTEVTQFRLKQSCPQKKLSLPIFWQVGHCRVSASLSQSPPAHLRTVLSAASAISEFFSGNFRSRS